MDECKKCLGHMTFAGIVGYKLDPWKVYNFRAIKKYRMIAIRLNI